LDQHGVKLRRADIGPQFDVQTLILTAHFTAVALE
jgi:hypothetical protein